MFGRSCTSMPLWFEMKKVHVALNPIFEWSKHKKIVLFGLTQLIACCWNFASNCACFLQACTLAGFLLETLQSCLCFGAQTACSCDVWFVQIVAKCCSISNMDNLSKCQIIAECCSVCLKCFFQSDISRKPTIGFSGKTLLLELQNKWAKEVLSGPQLNMGQSTSICGTSVAANNTIGNNNDIDKINKTSKAVCKIITLISCWQLRHLSSSFPVRSTASSTVKKSCSACSQSSNFGIFFAHERLFALWSETYKFMQKI